MARTRAHMERDLAIIERALASNQLGMEEAGRLRNTILQEYEQMTRRELEQDDNNIRHRDERDVEPPLETARVRSRHPFIARRIRRPDEIPQQGRVEGTGTAGDVRLGGFAQYAEAPAAERGPSGAQHFGLRFASSLETKRKEVG